MGLDNNRFCEYKDIYNIYKLITKIDKNYRLCFDKKNKQFVVINIAKNNQICCKTKSLCLNFIKFLQVSRVENINKIVKDIEENNSLILQKNKDNMKDLMSVKMKDVLDISKRVSNISNESINKIIGEKVC